MIPQSSPKVPQNSPTFPKVLHVGEDQTGGLPPTWFTYRGKVWGGERINDLRAPQHFPNTMESTKMATPTRYRSLQPKRMVLAPPVAETPLGKRMLEVLGPDEFQVLRTFQQEFGAKLVHYQDAQGEAGKKPGWADESR